MADVVQKWYADFVDLEQVLLFETDLMANYMDIKPLLGFDMCHCRQYDHKRL
jgi:S-phase kinase-associated protein 1